MFFDRLKNECDELNTSPSAIALKIGISKANVTNWKNGSVPSRKIAAKLAGELNVSADYLLGKTDIKSVKFFQSVLTFNPPPYY